jgi:hypothetical protein
MKFIHSIEILHGQHDLSSTARSPALKQPRAAGSSYNINRSMGTLSGGFPG